MINKEGTITFSEACTILKKSKRTVSRYIKAGKLNPKKIKSRKGIEYRFDLTELESLRKPDTTGQMTRQINFDDKNNDTLILLKDTIRLLQKQLKAKDKQIANFQDRQREANYLLKGLQDKILLLEDKSKGKPEKVSQAVILPDLGVTLNQSSNWQRIASIPEEKFEEYIQDKKEISF